MSLTKCVERNQGELVVLVGGITSRLNAIRTQIADPSRKVTGLCCIVQTSELELKQFLEPKCPKEGALVVRLYRAVLQDDIELICRQAK